MSRSKNSRKGYFPRKCSNGYCFFCHPRKKKITLNDTLKFYNEMGRPQKISVGWVNKRDNYYYDPEPVSEQRNTYRVPWSCFGRLDPYKKSTIKLIKKLKKQGFEIRRETIEYSWKMRYFRR